MSTVVRAGVDLSVDFTREREKSSFPIRRLFWPKFWGYPNRSLDAAVKVIKGATERKPLQVRGLVLFMNKAADVSGTSWTPHAHSHRKSPIVVTSVMVWHVSLRSAISLSMLLTSCSWSPSSFQSFLQERLSVPPPHGGGQTEFCMMYIREVAPTELACCMRSCVRPVRLIQSWLRRKRARSQRCSFESPSVAYDSPEHCQSTKHGSTSNRTTSQKIKVRVYPITCPLCKGLVTSERMGGTADVRVRNMGTI